MKNYTWATVCGHSVKAVNLTFFEAWLRQTVKKNWTWHLSAVHSSCTVEEFYSKTLFIHFDNQRKKKRIPADYKMLFCQTSPENASPSNVCDIQSTLV